MTIREVHWELTRRCNLNCKHCLVKPADPEKMELTTGQALAAIIKMSAAGVNRIAFTGGEPLLRRDILLLLAAANKSGIQTALITNGTLTNRQVMQSIRVTGTQLAISLESIDKEPHEEIRGEDTFTRTRQMIEKCREIDIPVDIYTTVTAVNLDQIVKLRQLCESLSGSELHLSEINIEGNALRYTEQLALTSQQRKYLKSLAGRVAKKPDLSCWVDGSVLYMDCYGNLYPCVELCQQGRMELVIGNIRQLNSQKLKAAAESIDRNKGPCRYFTIQGNTTTTTTNTGLPCSYILEQDDEYRTLDQLNAAWDCLFYGAEQYCCHCTYPSCRGYVWLLPQEIDPLYEAGVPLILVNRELGFIDSFSRDENGRIRVEQQYPECPQVEPITKQCTIHKLRPMSCRMYPVGLEPVGDRLVWALHRDCLIVETLEQEGRLDKFVIMIQNILKRISPTLYREIVVTYEKVADISKYPEGENSVIVIETEKLQRR